jgi:hypothetical protein
VVAGKQKKHIQRNLLHGVVCGGPSAARLSQPVDPGVACPTVVLNSSDSMESPLEGARAMVLTVALWHPLSFATHTNTLRASELLVGSSFRKAKGHDRV